MTFKYGQTEYAVHPVISGLKTLRPTYMLTGPRGAKYGLIPCRNRDGSQSPRMFAMNMRHALGSTPFDGERFIEHDGQIHLA